MKDATPQTVFLKDYRQPDFYIPSVNLDFVLNEEKTRVRSHMRIERNLMQASSRQAELRLNGEGLELKSLTVNGRKLAATEYVVSETLLSIAHVPDTFDLEIENEIEPQKNLSFEGLYKTSGMFCTQCEAESFRKITYFLDRPDVMSVFRVRIEADKAKYPLLLSNGNLIENKDLPNGRHEVTWLDPFKKPSYLFALVAGQLGVIEDTYVTGSGRQVKLQIFAREGLQERCRHAMESLKLSMKWDEDTYGLEYDLDLFMIVVAEDFNMGAMENKGLNVFNANYVLANPQTATDTDYDNILAVVGHEYFHNWTGNRVTCRDWFQLSLKEGLTVFRDQRFSGDMTSEAVHRIDQVIQLRTSQFSEDSGPMAHPIRPQSYITIDNFYTITVYEKGAEVIRMIETLVGRDGFRKGMDLYFKRHDGQAVTTEDFVAAMAEANSIDLTQFKNWYDQAGTPVVKVQTEFDASKEVLTVTLEQTCPPTPGQSTKKPFHIPIRIGLLDADGKDLRLGSGATVLHLRESKERFAFKGIKTRPVLSFLRGFSAPIKVEFEMSDDDLEFLMAHDSDGFARWEAAQNLTVRIVKDLVHDYESGHRLRDPERLLRAIGHIIDNDQMDPAFKSYMLALPNEQYLSQFFNVVNVDAIHAAREHILRAIERTFKGQLLVAYREITIRNLQTLDPRAKGERSLKNRLLELITLSDAERDLDMAMEHFKKAKNMTDELGGLSALNRTPSTLRMSALHDFAARWKNEPLVMNKWLAIQAVSPSYDTFQRVKDLAESPYFDKTNPNKIYSLILAFARYNLVRFHDKSGEAYAYIADQIMDIDSRNPQVAARLMSTFNQWKNFDQDRQALMKAQIQRILSKPKLSSNVFEIASKTLQG